MLIANYSIINQICGHNHSGITNPLKWIRPHVMRGYFTYADEGPNDEQIRRDSFPTGTNPPYSLIMGDGGTLLVSSNTTDGVGALTGNAAMGRAIASTIAGTGALTSNLSLIIQLACADLNGIGGLSASMSGIIQMASTLAGSGNLAASLQLISYVVCNMSGSGAVTATLRGTASLEADITPFTTLSPDSLAAAVWNALAANFNDAGTMGEKMNDAGSAANPWTEVITGTYTAADILKILSAVVAGKSSGHPLAPIFRDIIDSKDSVSGTVDANGNRTNVNIDP